MKEQQVPGARCEVRGPRRRVLRAECCVLRKSKKAGERLKGKGERGKPGAACWVLGAAEKQWRRNRVCCRDTRNVSVSLRSRYPGAALFSRLDRIGDHPERQYQLERIVQ